MASSDSASTSTLSPPRITNSTTSTSPPTIVLSNIAQLLPIKLDNTNYMLWKSLFQSILLSHRLEGYIDGSLPPPAKLVEAADGSQSSNPLFVEWFERDQALLSWINATLSISVLPYIVGLRSSKDVWDSLERRYSSLSCTHVIELKKNLQKVRKDSMSMQDYLHEIKVIADQLAACGSPMDEGDIIHHTLSGLSSAYRPFQTAIRTRSRSDPVSLEELHTLLISEELSMADDIVPASSTALSAVKSSSRPNNFAKGSHRGSNGQQPYRASEQMERSISVSHNEEEPANLLVTSLSEKLESLSSISPDCCIYWVPEQLRELNEKAYTPRVVSIGPLHHGCEGLQAMEEHKLRYLKDFFQRSNVSLEDCVKLLKEREVRVRNSYVETFDQFSSNEFPEMILVDAVFVIEVMLRFYHSSNLPDAYAYECDRIFSKPWLIKEIGFDMLLLENQLPFFILEDLFAMAKITVPPENDVRRSLIRITHYIFKDKTYVGEIEKFLETLYYSKIEHIVDFVRICHLSHELPPKKNLKSLCIPIATQLHQAGVTFRVQPPGNVNPLYGIRFQNGILEIPPLILWPTTEIIFQNLVAFERCHFNEN